MEEKDRIEEETRRALALHGFDELLTAQSLGLDLDYVADIRKKMKQYFKKNPDESLVVAENISALIKEGHMQVMRNLWEMREIYRKRGQRPSCEVCSSDVREDTSQSVPAFYCPKCGTHVKTILRDFIEMAQLELEIIGAISAQNDKLISNMAKMDLLIRATPPTLVGEEPPPQKPAGQLEDKRQASIGDSVEEKNIVDGYMNLRPLDRAIFIEKLRKDLVRLYAEYRQEGSAGSDNRGDSNTL